MVRAATATAPRTDRMTIVGVFHDQHEAQEAIKDLRAAGFREDEIGLIAHDETGGSESEDGQGNKAGEGAAIGAAAGAGTGVLWAIGIAAGMVPAIGPVIAGGILGSVLLSAAGGAAVGGLAGALIGLGIPEDEAEYYENEFRSGRTLVTVKTASRREKAWGILERHHAYDVETEGTATDRITRPDVGARNVELREEQLRARKDTRRAGEVDVHKDVVTEHKTMDVPVEREEVVIERHPTSRTTSGEIGEDEEIRIPLREEEAHVEKSPVVREEVSIGKRKRTEHQKVAGDAKHEELHVDTEGNARVSEAKGTGRNTPKKAR